jgi:hypothetical protein
MTESIKVLGQLKPAAATLSALYTVPALNFAVGSTLTVCEQGGVVAAFRIAVSVAGAAISAEQYIAFNTALAANETKAFTLGITLGAGDVVRVYSSTGNVSFNLFGSETAP